MITSQARVTAASAGAGRLDLAIAAGLVFFSLCLRLPMLGEWSLWLDEETSISHAYRLEGSFARAAIAYFLPLRALFDVVGPSVWWGRLWSVVFGAFSVALLYGMCRTSLSRRTSVLAAVLMSLCLQHQFWSQSIRYYTMLLALELAASWLFLIGVRSAKALPLLLGGLVAALALLVHNTAMLMLPVWVAFLGVLWGFGRIDFRRVVKASVLAISPFAAVTLAILPLLAAVQAEGLTGLRPVFQSPVPLAINLGFYYGLPIVLLALAAIAAQRTTSSDVNWLLACLAVVPVLETAVLGMTALANVTIHHAFVSVAGTTGLAGVALAGLLDHRPRWGRAALVASAVYYLTFLGLYFTQMHGDRERWKEATAELARHADISPNLTSPVPIYSTAHNVVNFYLGVPPRETIRHNLVRTLPPLASLQSLGDAWCIVDSFRIPAGTEPWLRENADTIATFPARTGPRDRTITVYRVRR